MSTIARRSFIFSLAALLGLADPNAARLARAEAPQGKPLELNVVVASSAMTYPALWLALADNMFEKNNLHVNVTYNALTTGAAMLVSGKADIFVTNALAGLRIAKEGRQVSYLWNFSYIDATAWGFVTRSGIKSMSELAAMGSNCRIVSLPPGSAHYAYLQGILRSYKLSCSVGTVAMMPLLTSGVSSSQFDAAPVTPMDGYTMVENGKANMLVDPQKITPEEMHAIYPYAHSLTAAFGIKDDLPKKRGAVILFLKTLRQANKALLELEDQQIVSKFRKLTDVFGTTTPASLEVQWKLEKHLVPTGDQAGELRSADWKDLLDAASTVWNLAGVKAGDPELQYNEVVDMSYFKAAAP
ncbi:hypothetical protein [Bradyrhizobium sp. 187]|uniref:hypothetical protein n=1 Tax=Bradyrhizobium sp. 187 TaxID=2782655 RepID=UPI0020000C63|nr:hypothetical protein [Bradyrhizobium sp. 187]UPJ71833.1 hypothetical protein IVB19_30150 [Bradyrhizobium sp. 187]